MRDARFKYEAYLKCYYVDRHEDPDVMADRAKYIPKCFEVEMREHVWVQLPLDTYSRPLEFKRKENEPQNKRKSSGEVKLDSTTAEGELINKFHELLTYHYVKEGKPNIESKLTWFTLIRIRMTRLDSQN
jgi:hypothetical protein